MGWRSERLGKEGEFAGKREKNYKKNEGKSKKEEKVIVLVLHLY